MNDSMNVHRLSDLLYSHFSGPSPTCIERNVRGNEWGVLKTTCSTTEGWNWRAHKVLPPAFWNLTRLEVKCGDSIITKAGPRHRVGVASFVDFVPPQIVPSGKMICLRPNPQRVLPGYLALALSDSRTQRYLDQRTTGMAESQVNFENKALLGAPVWLPERDEQERILGALTGPTAAVTSLERLIAKKQAIKQGMIQALLSGTSRLAGFDAPWTPTAIASLGPLLKGRGVKRDDVRAAGVPCIRYGELYTTFSNYTDTTVSFVDPDVANTALPIAEGDLLFAGSGETKADIGTCVAYVGRSPAVAGGDITVLRAPSVNPVFLASLLNTPQISAMKARWGQGDAVVHISASAIGELQVELPERSEQDAIARLIVDADRDLAAQATLLDVLRNIRQGMMQELLTARTRLNRQPAAA